MACLCGGRSYCDCETVAELVEERDRLCADLTAMTERAERAERLLIASQAGNLSLTQQMVVEEEG